MRRKTRGLLSWAVTGVLTLGLGTGVVLMTAASTALTAASTTATTTTTATSPSTPIVLRMIPSPGYVDDSYPSSSRTASYDN